MKPTNEIIDIHLEIEEAFNKQFSFSKDEDNYISDNDLQNIINSLNIQMGVNQFKRYFRAGAFTNKPVISTASDLNRYCKYLFKILNYLGYSVQTETKAGVTVPKIDNNMLSLLKQTEIPRWYLYYYSETKDENSERETLASMNVEQYSNFNEGKIFIDEAESTADHGTAKIILSTHTGIEFKSEWFKDELNTIYYRIERKKKNRFPFTQMVFKMHEHMNFHIGVYCAATRGQTREPYAGTIIAVKGNVDQKDQKLKSLLHYLLRHKRFQEKYSFRFPLNSQQNNYKRDVPESARIWELDVLPLEGTYVIYFTDPYDKIFIRGFMKICKNGSVFLFTYKNYRNKPYIGVVKKIHGEGMENNIIINLGFHRKENEYRVRIFLSKTHFDATSKKPEDKKFAGIYSALQKEEGKPFSSLFVASMYKEDLHVSDIKKIFNEDKFEDVSCFEFNISNQKKVSELLKSINDPLVKKYFGSTSSSNKQFALKL